jgi:hypothetical protein
MTMSMRHSQQLPNANPRPRRFGFPECLQADGQDTGIGDSSSTCCGISRCDFYVFRGGLISYAANGASSTPAPSARVPASARSRLGAATCTGMIGALPTAGCAPVALVSASPMRPFEASQRGANSRKLPVMGLRMTLFYYSPRSWETLGLTQPEHALT